LVIDFARNEQYKILKDHGFFIFRVKQSSLDYVPNDSVAFQILAFSCCTMFPFVMLLQVEKQMVASVQNEIERSHSMYPECNRASWVLEWAGQVAQCVAMIYWTAEVQHALSLQQLQTLTEYYKHLQVRITIFAITCFMHYSYKLL
jgi:hypothetical protein